MNDILFAQEFAKELEAESQASIKCLERIPAEKFGFKPHERSMEMGYMALLVAEIPGWISYTLANPHIDFATYPHDKATNPQELVDLFKTNSAKAKESLSAIKEGILDDPFDLRKGDEILLRSTRREQLSSMINHLVHHRGQLRFICV
ncbi:DinB family protein [Mucilaginibacter sp. UYCu711]|uniref:DinB family protein n=1 Tax=Mucilaginibacter sp. UYCu711 TaxID=3156339 RepID=UPI003D224662